MVTTSLRFVDKECFQKIFKEKFKKKILSDLDIMCTKRFTYRAYLHYTSGPGSSVAIATDYGLDGPGWKQRKYLRWNRSPKRTGYAQKASEKDERTMEETERTAATTYKKRWGRPEANPRRNKRCTDRTGDPSLRTNDQLSK